MILPESEAAADLSKTDMARRMKVKENIKVKIFSAKDLMLVCVGVFSKEVEAGEPVFLYFADSSLCSQPPCQRR